MKMKRGVILVFQWIALFAMSSSSPYAAEPLRLPDADGQLANDMFADAIGREVFFGHYEPVDEMLTYYAANKERIADGRWKLSFVRAGIALAVSHPNWEIAFARIEDWKKRSPNSVAAVFYEYAYWHQYAWDARGGGYANTVTPEGWKLYYERLRKAESVLVASKAYASANPEWYALYLNCALELGWPLDQRLRLFSEAIKKEPYYYETYFAMLRGLLPKWGGSFAQVANLVEEAVKATREQDGESMYARIYWNVAQNEDLGTDLFRDAGASWPRMKKGFEDLQTRYPKSLWTMNNFASFACRARDKETFLKLRPTVAKFLSPAAWPSNYSLDLCTHMFTAAS